MARGGGPDDVVDRPPLAQRSLDLPCGARAIAAQKEQTLGRDDQHGCYLRYRLLHRDLRGQGIPKPGVVGGILRQSRQRIQKPSRFILLRIACSLRGRSLRSNSARTFWPRP